MEKFYLEEASLKRKEQAIEYILEHKKYNSNTAGTSGLDDDYQNYEKWLEKLETLKNKETCPNDYCLGLQYFLIRESDEKLIGMYNLRWNLNDWMLTYGGHIGYGVRPTERYKGYNKIGLYLTLLKAQELGLDKVLLTAVEDNIGSIKTILALGGVLENEVYNETKEKHMGRYWINVDKSLKKYSNVYNEKIVRIKK